MSQNYFEIFQLPIQYTLDEKKLDASYRAILSSIHPDRFVNATEAEKTQSLMKSTLVNDAYTILKNPIQRAEYLLEINNVSQHVKLDNAFLMQQMEWEERLEAEEDVVPLNQFHDEVLTDLKQKFNHVEVLLDHEKNFTGVANELAQLKFLAKLAQKIKDKTFLLLAD
ncbi:MAG: Fe-S protein assembly co-chaperone HscB [Methylophilaceae bacterium]|nr:Fe-S protein assembly co-chaperone HscB [Methylophilaceae bacterium]MBL6728408.1 Fe-S protein assembly co-chaperone HscB [Methylophilaceae bacterium]